jgi:hypothetical protein
MGRKEVRTDKRGLRTCLRCGKKFMGTGPENRICPKCKESRGYRNNLGRAIYYWRPGKVKKAG